MIFRRKRREVPGLNTTSTADISFMLLVFFLVTTSMDADKGMNRQLPPKQDEKQEMMDVDRLKVMSLALSEEGLLTIDEKIADIDKIRRQLKEFIVSAGPSHIIELKTDRKCDYDTYFHLQNEIVRSYREIRNRLRRNIRREYRRCISFNLSSLIFILSSNNKCKFVERNIVQFLVLIWRVCQTLFLQFCFSS